MSEEMIIKHCSPTLAGIKTGNMFSCAFDNTEQMKESIRTYNRLLNKKGLRVLPLRHKDNRALVYIFRPEALKEDLCDDLACRILKDKGYCTSKADRCVVHLIKRIGELDAFPHEVGLFLGYPPEDVSGFICNEECKFSGLWKVYGDVNTAQEKFEQYKKCTESFSKRYADGCSLDNLAVNN